MRKKLLYYTNTVFIFLLLLLNATPFSHAQRPANGPVRMAVAGITHGHVGWILGRNKPDVALVGVFEADKELALRYANKYGFDTNIIFNDLGKMLDAVKPDAVVAFGSIYEHMQVVEACAPRQIDVMVEKPLAATMKHAIRMEALANKYKINVLTNFETSWYPSTFKTYHLVNDSNYIGKIKKVVIHDGHEGPKEIGVNKEFLEWLTDPVQNGGGAIVDFGCYGANLMTYLMNGEQPVSVTAITRQFKPGVYPKVDDEATIIISYPSAQCIVQASWNWPFGRKDMEVYGEKGYVISPDNTTMRIRRQPDTLEHTRLVTAADVNIDTDPFSYFAGIILKKIKEPANGLYALKTNVTVVRILEAAKESARTGKTVYFKMQ